MLQPAHHAIHFRLKSRLSHPLGACFATHQVTDGTRGRLAVEQDGLHCAHNRHLDAVALSQRK
jgi:hypothetical protein